MGDEERSKTEVMEEAEEGAVKEDADLKTVGLVTLGVAGCLTDIDGEDFDRMIVAYGQEDERREEMIKKSR